MEHRELLAGGKQRKEDMELPSEHLSEMSESRRRRVPAVKRDGYKAPRESVSQSV